VVSPVAAGWRDRTEWHDVARSHQLFPDGTDAGCRSCIVDGIQISSGCTLGKGNLTVQPDHVPKALFSTDEGKCLEIILKETIREEIDTTVTEENIVGYSEKMFDKSNEELFEVL